jgi:hypothetical protein
VVNVALSHLRDFLRVFLSGCVFRVLASIVVPFVLSEFIPVSIIITTLSSISEHYFSFFVWRCFALILNVHCGVVTQRETISRVYSLVLSFGVLGFATFYVRKKVITIIWSFYESSMLWRKFGVIA